MNYQDPFISLMDNKKVNANYWSSKAGVPSYGLQDDTIIALRKMGYQGTLGDMLRAFYKNLTGIDDLTTAWAKAIYLPDRTIVRNFVGKSNGDGDNSRLLKYGTFPTMVLPSQYTSEAVSGYAGAAAEGGTVGTWSSTTPAGSYCQFCCFFSLAANGNVAFNVQNIKELKVYAKVVNSVVKVFNQRTGLWEDRFTNTDYSTVEATTIELNDGQLTDYLGTDNVIKIGTMARNVATGGSPSSLTQIDFINVTVKSLK